MGSHVTCLGMEGKVFHKHLFPGAGSGSQCAEEAGKRRGGRRALHFRQGGTTG